MRDNPQMSCDVCSPPALAVPTDLRAMTRLAARNEPRSSCALSSSLVRMNDGCPRRTPSGRNVGASSSYASLQILLLEESSQM